MKKSVSKFTRTGFTCLALLAGVAAATAEVSKATATSATPATTKHLSAEAKALKKRMAKVYKPSRDAKKQRDLLDFLNGASLLGSGNFRPALLPSEILPAATTATSGTLTATTTAYTYSTAPWVITAGNGTYPDLGGTATFAPITGATPGTVGAVSTVTFDVSPTLGGIVFNTPIQYVLATATGQTIVAPTTGLTLNTQATAQNIVVNGLPISIAFGSQITGTISGGGSTGLTKTGTGNVYLIPTAANTYTGGTHFNGGFTTIGGTAAVGDGVFGATGTGNDLSFNGGSVLFNTTGGLTTSRNVFIDTGGATFLANTATTINGVVSGPGAFNNFGFGGTALTLTGVNTYTGATVSRGTNASLALSGTGTITTTPSYDLMGTFTLINTGTNVTDRVSDTAPITLRGLNFVDTGNATANSSETIGAVTSVYGFNTFLVTPGTTAPASLTMASITRQNNSTLDFRGTGLGSAPGTTIANIYATTAPTLTGGAGAAGSTTISILPYAIGNSTNSVLFTAAGQISSSFVTYGANGFRTLDPTTEYATAFGVNNTDNVRITAATAVAAPVTANAVLLAPATAAASALSGGPINLTSGAFLYSPTANVTGTVSVALNFGTAEGFISNTSLLTMSGVLSGSGGLTLTTAYAPTNNYTPNLTLTGANTFTGNTTINAGAIGFSGTIAGGNAGAFGTNGTVTLNAGRILASLAPTAATTFGFNINVIGNGSDYISPSTSGFTSTFNGNISLSNNLNLEGYINAATSALIFNGTISGTGSLTDISYTYGVLNGNNTYSGGTILGGASSASTYYAGTDTAFGTGPIYFNNISAIAGVGTTARTLANALFVNGTANFAGTAPLIMTGNLNLNGSATVASANTALTAFNGVVSNGSFTKGGVGAIALNSTTGNTFTGGFVNTGVAATASVIYANNTSGSAFGTGAVSVGAASATVFSTLAGNFTTSGATSIGGRLSPGDTSTGATPALTPATAGIGAIGTVNFGSALTMSSSTTSSLYLEMASATSADKINVTGVLSLAGTINLATTNGYVLQKGNTYDFLDFGSLVGTSYTFNTTNVTFASSDLFFEVSNFQGAGVLTVVPEPATVLGGVFTAGLLGLGIRRRMRTLAAR